MTRHLIPIGMTDVRAHRLYLLLAWSAAVPDRDPDARRRAAIESEILASCRRAGAEPIEVSVEPHRVCLLLRLPAALAVETVERRIRRDVEGRLAVTGRVVRWASGFAAATVSPRGVKRARKRVATLEGGTGPWWPRTAKRDGTRGAVETRTRRDGTATTERRRTAWSKRSSSPPRGSGGS